ncbi:phospholipid-transporting ATPase ABCA3-like [Haemaphysalis longicornis]
MGCIVCYLDNVVPWGYGVPKPLYYFLKMEYWHPTKQFELRGMSSSRDTRFYEPDPKDSTAVVHMVNLCAKGQSNSADVTDVNLTILDTQITVILGPPNCGCSTILEVLMGKLVPTSGAAYVCNYSVDSISGVTAVNVSAFLDERALFDNLTVEEHLFFYALVGSTDADAYVDWALNAVRMEPYKDCLVSQLSPRLRTSLCMAIAMCRVKQARLMIFDEPTRLMDERHRRSMWLTLEDVAKYSAVLVTTSSVEDAEMLAHRLVIMNQGRVVCAGSPGWLKTRFGVGCYLRLTTMRSFRAERVTRIVQQHMGPVEPVRVTCLEAVFNLTVTATNIKNMASMLHTLEKMRNSLGIMHMRLSSCSLEDIFVKLAHRTAVKETPDAGDAQGATVPTVMDTAKAVEEADALKQLCSARGSEADVWSVLCALFLKRALMWRRVWWTKSLSVLLPAASLVMLALCEHHFLPARAAPRNNATYVLRTFFDDTKTQGFVEVVDNASKPFGHSVVLPTMAEHGVQTFSPKTINVDRELLFWAEQGNVYDYIRHYQFGVSLLNKSGSKLPVFLWFNGQCPHSAALVVNMFHTAMLRDCTGKKDSAITLVNSLSLNDSLSEKIEYERVHGRLSLPAGRTRLGHETELFMERNVITRAFHSFFLSLAASSYSASHVVAPMTEQKSGLKHLQLMTGMSGFVYWMGHFLFDFCMAAGSSYFLTAIMYFSHSGSETIYYLAIMALFLANAFASIPLAYLVSEAFHSRTWTFCFFALVLFLGGLLGSVSTELFVPMVQRYHVTGASSSVLFVWFFLLRWFPTYSLVQGVTKVVMLHKYNAICTTGGMLLAEACRDSHLAADERISPCCQARLANDTMSLLDPLEPWRDTGFYEAARMVLQGVLYIVMLSIIDSQLVYRVRWLVNRRVQGTEYTDKVTMQPRGPRIVDSCMDAEVEEEASLVDQVFRCKAFGEGAMTIQQICKTVGIVSPVRLLEGVSFQLNRGECLGLVGIHDSGKSTLLDILVGLTMPTQGGAHTASASMGGNLRAWQRGIGYAPDGIYKESMPALTVGEILDIVARLRGVKPGRPAVTSVLSIVGKLNENRMANECSYGEIKMLLIALAVIGTPPVVLLDEPYSDLRKLERDNVVHMLQLLKSARAMSILMTSHQ